VSALVAVLSKKGGDAAEKAIAMLKLLGHTNPRAFAIASSNTITIEESYQAVNNRDNIFSSSWICGLKHSQT